MNTEQASILALQTWRKAAFLGIDPESFVPFGFYIPLTKAAITTRTSPDTGIENWIIDGPLSDPGMDLEGEEMDMRGLRKGLTTFFDLHAPVDWDHLWEKTREPKWLIGRGVAVHDAPHPVTGNSVPWLQAELFKDKDVAGQAISHLQAGGSLGYSVAGGVVKKSGNKILEPIVTSVAVTPVPVVSANTGCISLIKSLQRMMRGEASDLPVPPELMGLLTPFPVLKALEGLASLPHTGPGVSALMTEEIVGTQDDEERRKKKRRAIKKALDLSIAARLASIQAALYEE